MINSCMTTITLNPCKLQTEKRVKNWLLQPNKDIATSEQVLPVNTLLSYQELLSTLSPYFLIRDHNESIPNLPIPCVWQTKWTWLQIHGLAEDSKLGKTTFLNVPRAHDIYLLRICDLTSGLSWTFSSTISTVSLLWWAAAKLPAVNSACECKRKEILAPILITVIRLPKK